MNAIEKLYKKFVMKSSVVLFILFSLSNFSFGQRQADNWVWGICNGNGLCAPPFGSGILKFNENGVESITSKYWMKINPQS